MKALPFIIPSIKNESIKVDNDILEQFYPHYHTHKELQLMWILKGEGTTFIGDAILPFQKGDVFLLSSNLPHVFKSEATKNGVESLSIFFPKQLFTINQQFPEFEHINHFLDHFNQGLVFKVNQADMLKKHMNSIETSKGLKRILQLMELIDSVVLLKDKQYIASSNYASPDSNDGEKISTIIEHLYANYSKNITLTKVADIANLSPPAFCRYFKRHTKKTMVQYLNQIRIGKVCGWLQEKKYTVTECCYQAGFNNISNFNRQFKSITGFTPSGYMTKQKILSN